MPINIGFGFFRDPTTGQLTVTPAPTNTAAFAGPYSSGAKAQYAAQLAPLADLYGGAQTSALMNQLNVPMPDYSGINWADMSQRDGRQTATTSVGSARNPSDGAAGGGIGSPFGTVGIPVVLGPSSPLGGENFGLGSGTTSYPYLTPAAGPGNVQQPGFSPNAPYSPGHDFSGLGENIGELLGGAVLGAPGALLGGYAGGAIGGAFGGGSSPMPYTGGFGPGSPGATFGGGGYAFGGGLFDPNFSPVGFFDSE